MKDSHTLVGIDPRILFPALLGALFSLALYKFWGLHWRGFVIAVSAVAGLSLAMVLIGNVGKLGLYAFLFAIPVSSVEKWLFTGTFPEEWLDDQLWSGYIGVGPIDIVIVALYLSWLFRIFVTREARFPRLEKIDGLVLLLLAAYCISMIGAPRLNTGIFATVFLLKHLLAYFYVSRHLMLHHLRWVVIAVLFALALETGLGILQTQFHLLEGIARHKGAHVEERKEQHTVRGIESFKRAEGTLLDSHSFGIYLAMLVAFPFILMQDEEQRTRMRLLHLALFLGGCAGVVLSFSRSAWVGFAASIPWAFLVMASTGHKHVLRSVMISLLAAMLLAPWAAGYLWLRFARAPAELIDWRMEGYAATLPILRHHFLFGFGVGNYLDALRTYSQHWAPELNVHNVFLWIWAETGLLGIIAWYGTILAVFRRCWRVARRGRGLVRQLAYCPLIAITAYSIDGMAEPLYREPVVFMFYWFLVALAVALTRLAAEDPMAGAAAAST